MFCHCHDGKTIPDRRLYCASYDRCLDHAVERKWPSWACGDCREYFEISFHQHRQDLEGLAKCLDAIVSPGKRRQQRDKTDVTRASALRRALRQRRRAAGACENCGFPAVEGKRLCRDCYQHAARYAAERRRAC